MDGELNWIATFCVLRLGHGGLAASCGGGGFGGSEAPLLRGSACNYSSQKVARFRVQERTRQVGSAAFHPVIFAGLRSAHTSLKMRPATSTWAAVMHRGGQKRMAASPQPKSNRPRWNAAWTMSSRSAGS